MWSRSAQAFILRITRLRFAALTPLGLLLVAMWRWDQGPARHLHVLGLAGVLGVTALFFAGQRWLFLRLGVAPWLVTLDLSASLLIFGAILVLTGGTDSPVMVVIPAAAMFITLHPARPRPLPLLLGMLIAPPLIYAVVSLLAGRGPAPPSFFVPLAGGARPAYTGLLVTIVTAATLLMGLLGGRLREAMEKVVHDAGQARAGEVAALLSHNREILRASQTLAHELKNPLASLQGLTQLMERAAPQRSKEAERLGVMLREIARMRGVLDELRRLARPLSELELQAVRLDALVHDVLVLQQGQAQARGVTLASDVAVPLPWCCDPQKLKAALLNLLQNSLEAARPGDRIEFQVAVGAAEARLAIKDSGPGLSPEARQHLFTPGFSTKEGGSGIGLLLARQVAQQHGGDLSVDDAPGGGCLVTLRLPRRSPSGGPP